MAFWDSLITFAIVVAAAYYLYRRFSKVDKSEGCGGCGSGSACCNGQHGEQSSGDCDSSR